MQSEFIKRLNFAACWLSSGSVCKMTRSNRNASTRQFKSLLKHAQFHTLLIPSPLAMSATCALLLDLYTLAECKGWWVVGTVVPSTLYSALLLLEKDDLSCETTLVRDIETLDIAKWQNWWDHYHPKEIFNNVSKTFLNTPVPFKEISLCHVLPPHRRLDALGRHPVAKLRDVLRVSRLQHRVLKHPELLAWKFKKRRGKKINKKKNREEEEKDKYQPRLPPGSNTRLAVTDASLVTIGRQ